MIRQPCVRKMTLSFDGKLGLFLKRLLLAKYLLPSPSCTCAMGLMPGSSQVRRKSLASLSQPSWGIFP